MFSLEECKNGKTQKLQFFSVWKILSSFNAKNTFLSLHIIIIKILKFLNVNWTPLFHINLQKKNFCQIISISVIKNVDF